MFGQMTAGSWIYIGTQGILQGTYQTFAAAGEKHFGTPDLTGRTILTAGLGGMGGAQPLAAAMTGAAILCIEVDPSRIERRLETRYLDEAAGSLDDALARVRSPRGNDGRCRSGLLGNAADVVPELARRGELLRSRHRPDRRPRSLDRIRPAGLDVTEAAELRARDPDAYLERARGSIAAHVQGLLEYVRAGCYVFDYGNNLRGEAYAGGVEDAFTYPGFVPAYIRPLFCRGVGPFRWAALSGDPADIAGDRSWSSGELFPDDELLRRWLELAPGSGCIPGSSGADLLARLRRPGSCRARDQRARAARPRHRPGGDRPRPPRLGIGRLPYRETEAMRDGSDAIADWPILNALLNVAAGATWVSVHHGGGVGIGNSIHAGMVVVADGTDAAAERLERVLTTDPGTGVMRHADAGYEEALDDCASRRDRPAVDCRAGYAIA